MLLLFETAAGLALFKVLDEKKLQKVDDLHLEFESPERVNKIVKLKHFQEFFDTTEALAATTSIVEGKLCKPLQKLLKKEARGESADTNLMVLDPKLGTAIKEKFSINCISNNVVNELFRCIRSKMDSLISGISNKDINAMSLGLSHSLSRYKLKFNPDKIDIMIIQAIGLLEDLDKELNNYVMRCREWYGWHFPELSKIVTDYVQYAKLVKFIGTRDRVKELDLSEVLSEELEEKVKNAAEISVGTEISVIDRIHIEMLCNEIIEIADYRKNLSEYLSSRMMAIAPNLTVLIGELVGARLIANAGSLSNLAKCPASTLQILGAEKALFRALKTKRETPKYGLIYHSHLLGQAAAPFKGKLARMLAAKASLATRVDAFGEDSTVTLGAEHKVLLEKRLRIMEESSLRAISGTAKARAKFQKYQTKTEIEQYPIAADSKMTSSKRAYTETEAEDEPFKKTVKSEDDYKEDTEQYSATTPQDAKMGKKKKRKHSGTVKTEPSEEAQETEEISEQPIQKKKKKKKKSEADDVE